ncbi:MAG: diguanylate cyclase [Treponema sp.]|nr:diguanylate cyclase [Treponema sp.]
MKSIKTKIILIVLSGIIASSFIVGSFGLFWSSKAIQTESSQILDLMAQVQTGGLNSMFSEIEHSSIVLSQHVEENLKDFSLFKNEDNFLRYMEKLEDIAFYIANCTSSAMAVYVRFAPELTNEVKSLLWRKKDGVFSKDTLPAFPVYDSDFGNSWYYRAHALGTGVWTLPYYNDDFKEYVISYGVPVYKEGEFVAVVGMDIDFDDIASIVNSISVYDSGYAFLTDEAFIVTYHRSIRAGVQILEQAADFKQTYIPELHTSLYEYIFKNEKFRMLYKPLVNGMRLVVSVPVQEIDRARTELFITILFSVLVIALLLSAFSVWMSNRLTRPLDELTHSATKIIAGNYDVRFSRKPNDEIGSLMDTFIFMAKSLKIQFEYINSLVYYDSMTGAKNKRAFIDVRNEFNRKISEAKDKNEKLEFGVIVFDVNNLKYLNDTFGHKEGDALIKNACALITRIFSESPIFRIGGDEFVSVIAGKDFENRNELLTKFRSEMDYLQANKSKASEQLSIASGIAVYDAKNDVEFQTVFERADEEMYKTKIAMKGGISNIR